MGSSTVRLIPDSMDPVVVAEVDARLVAVARDHEVRVLWAIESGSRAWGFPSPDSDYDCRFLYVRRPATYTSLWPVRDVIETPLDRIFDVNGWDLAKAVRLAVGGNATVGEWLRSPIVYSGDPDLRDSAVALVDVVADRSQLTRHYLHVGRNQLDRAGDGRLKRVFYALRPALALRWLRQHPDRVAVPMDLPTLLLEVDLPAAAVEQVEDLVALKARTREMGTGSVPAEVRALVAAELEHAETTQTAPDPTDLARRRVVADQWFQQALERWA